jgi:hypothetical protein
VGHRTDLGAVEEKNILHFRELNPGLFSPSLYCLSYLARRAGGGRRGENEGG